MTFSRRAHPNASLALFESEWRSTTDQSFAIALAEKGLRVPFTNDDLASILSLLNSVAASASPHHRNQAGSITWSYSSKEHSFLTTVQAPEILADLPNNVGVKGGVARSLLLSLLGVPTLPPRDIDIIRKGSFRAPSDEDLARRYMSDDYRFGARVELFDSASKHLSSRDITINEVMYFNGTLMCSPFAALDALTFTLRPSRYKGGTLSRQPQLLGRVLLKMLRLRAEMTHSGSNWRVVGIPDDAAFGEFDLALHLEKSLQRSPLIAESFLQHTQTAGFLEYSGSELLLPVLEDLIHFTVGESSVIRSLPQELKTHLKGLYPIDYIEAVNSKPPQGE
jgi:hypothetical protein